MEDQISDLGPRVTIHQVEQTQPAVQLFTTLSDSCQKLTILGTQRTH